MALRVQYSALHPHPRNRHLIRSVRQVSRNVRHITLPSVGKGLTYQPMYRVFCLATLGSWEQCADFKTPLMIA